MISGGYRRRLELFQKLRSVSEEMAAFSAEQLFADDQALARLQALMGQREDLMAEIDQITSPRKSGCRSVMSEAAEKRLRLEAEAVEASNAIIEHTVKAVLENLKTRTKKLREGKQSQRAYAGRAASAAGSFIDKRR